MSKSAPKNLFPIKKADGVAVDIALRSDCSSSVGSAWRKGKILIKFNIKFMSNKFYQFWATVEASCDSFA